MVEWKTGSDAKREWWLSRIHYSGSYLSLDIKISHNFAPDVMWKQIGIRQVMRQSDKMRERWSEIQKKICIFVLYVAWKSMMPRNEAQVFDVGNSMVCHAIFYDRMQRSKLLFAVFQQQELRIELVLELFSLSYLWENKFSIFKRQ